MAIVGLPARVSITAGFVALENLRSSVASRHDQRDIAQQHWTIQTEPHESSPRSPEGPSMQRQKLVIGVRRSGMKPRSIMTRSCL
jgi:hypothetical protein